MMVNASESVRRREARRGGGLRRPTRGAAVSDGGFCYLLLITREQEVFVRFNSDPISISVSCAHPEPAQSSRVWFILHTQDGPVNPLYKVVRLRLKEVLSTLLYKAAKAGC
jgi:hypothetical protein